MSRETPRENSEGANLSKPHLDKLELRMLFPEDPAARIYNALVDEFMAGNQDTSPTQAKNSTN
jgi:hypothetical protein